MIIHEKICTFMWAIPSTIMLSLHFRAGLIWGAYTALPEQCLIAVGYIEYPMQHTDFHGHSCL